MFSNRYFNPTGDEPLNQKIFGSNPTGFTNFNEAKYNWSLDEFKRMEDNSWFIGEVDTSNAKKQFLNMSIEEQDRFQLGFAQLSFNDSLQEDFLLDIRSLTSNKIVKSSLTLQAYQEANHSRAYSTLLGETGNSEDVFNLYKSNDALMRKNFRISEQFGRNIQGTTSDKLLLSVMASVALEGIYFQLGFANIYLFGKEKAQSAIDMVEFIARDELDTHLPLFTSIFKTIKAENNIDNSVYDACLSMVEEAVDIELEYGKELLKSPVLGMSEDILRDTVQNYANQRLKAIGLPKIYKDKPTTNLQKLVTSHRKINGKKTNFFEGNVKAYSKNQIDMEDF